MDTQSDSNREGGGTVSLVGAAGKPSCLTQLNLPIAKLVPLSNKVVVKALLATPWTKVQDEISVLKTTSRHSRPLPFLATAELPYDPHSLGLTCQGKLGSGRVELCRTLVRIHAIPQGQLGHPFAVLLPKVVGDGCIVLGSVGESLGTEWGTLINLQRICCLKKGMNGKQTCLAEPFAASKRDQPSGQGDAWFPWRCLCPSTLPSL